MGTGTNQTIPIFGGQVGDEDGPTLDFLREDLLGIYGRNIIWGDKADILKPTATNTQIPVIPTKPSQNNGSLKVYAFLMGIPVVFGLYFSS